MLERPMATLNALVFVRYEQCLDQLHRAACVFPGAKGQLLLHLWIEPTFVVGVATCFEVKPLQILVSLCRVYPADVAIRIKGEAFLFIAAPAGATFDLPTRRPNGGRRPKSTGRRTR